MAIYVYNTTTGALASWIPDSLTVSQAQANGQLAPNATLTVNGLSAIDSLPPLDSTHVWDAATKTVDTVAATTPAAPMPCFFFLMRFTPAEYAAISASTDTQVIQFWDAIRRCNVVDLTDPLIHTQGAHIVSLGLLTSARATTILTTPYVPSSQTS